MFDTNLSRRELLVGTSAAAAASFLGVSPGLAKAPLLNSQAPAFYRFKVGSIEATVVTDGPMEIGAPEKTFIGPSPQELGQMLTDPFLPPNNVVLDHNPLLINTSDNP